MLVNVVKVIWSTRVQKYFCSVISDIWVGLMTIWRITGKIIRTAIIITYAQF